MYCNMVSFPICSLQVVSSNNMLMEGMCRKKKTGIHNAIQVSNLFVFRGNKGHFLLYETTS